MDNIEQLRFKLELSKLKTNRQYNKAFNDNDFVKRFAKFIQTRLGQVWLRSDKSQKYRLWQMSQ